MSHAYEPWPKNRSVFDVSIAPVEDLGFVSES